MASRQMARPNLNGPRLYLTLVLQLITTGTHCVQKNGKNTVENNRKKRAQTKLMKT